MKSLTIIILSVLTLSFSRHISSENNLTQLKIPTVLFKFNSTDLVQDSLTFFYRENPSHQVLDSLVETLKRHPEIVIGIYGFCDPTEPDPANLSQRRADIIKKRLVNAGIETARIVATGKGIGDLEYIGESKEYSNQKNRRASFMILRFDYQSKKKSRLK
jgi:outer membrane protein OmpA-like peptidoglycan-associated protein